MQLPAKSVGSRKPTGSPPGGARPAVPIVSAALPKLNHSRGLRTALPVAASAYSARRPDPSPPPGPDGQPRPAPPVRELVRQLIVAANVLQPAAPGHAGGTPAPAGTERRTLLDVEVDGVRCLLVRTVRPVATGAGGAGVCLSPREREITRLITQGYPNKAIADVLDISAWTVCTHLRRIFSKFGVSSRAAMVARFLRTES